LFRNLSQKYKWKNSGFIINNKLNLKLIKILKKRFFRKKSVFILIKMNLFAFQFHQSDLVRLVEQVQVEENDRVVYNVGQHGQVLEKGKVRINHGLTVLVVSDVKIQRSQKRSTVKRKHSLFKLFGFGLLGSQTIGMETLFVRIVGFHSWPIISRYGCNHVKRRGGQK
jgi:hypothetical protein